MKIVFLDTEFTGEHRATTLVSLGMVTRDGAACDRRASGDDLRRRDLRGHAHGILADEMIRRSLTSPQALRDHVDGQREGQHR